jgi:hypothetical protein
MSLVAMGVLMQVVVFVFVEAGTRTTKSFTSAIASIGRSLPLLALAVAVIACAVGLGVSIFKSPEELSRHGRKATIGCLILCLCFYLSALILVAASLPGEPTGLTLGLLVILFAVAGPASATTYSLWRYTRSIVGNRDA